MNTTERCPICGSTMLLSILECEVCGTTGTHHEMENEHAHTAISNTFPQGRPEFLHYTTQKKCLECSHIFESENTNDNNITFTQ